MTTFEPSTNARMNGLLGSKMEPTISPPLKEKRRIGNGNASWGQASPKGKVSPKRTRNMFLQDNSDINSLLSLLHTNDFSGQYIKEHHSKYLNEPKIEIQEKKARRLGDSYHRSDGHLLRLQAKPTPIQSIQAL